ncbi:MAG: hypothetical protein F4169_10735, partial [Gammaproteobacteria bacterium]|nr:hypothetical protein [Gammaproteobacteria bacterium]
MAGQRHRRHARDDVRLPRPRLAEHAQLGAPRLLRHARDGRRVRGLDYTQYRLDFPDFGSPAAVVVSKGTHGSSGAEVLSKRHFAYASRTISHGSGAGAATTRLPYASAETALVHEAGTVLGAVQTATAAPTVTGTAVSGTVRTTTAGNSVDPGTAGTVWGDAGTQTVGAVQRKTTTTTVYGNVDTATAWLAGFPSSVTAKHFEGTSTSAMRTQKLTRTRATTSAGAQ